MPTKHPVSTRLSLGFLAFAALATPVMAENKIFFLAGSRSHGPEAGVMASSVAMEKDIAKVIMKAAGVPVPEGRVVTRQEAARDHVLPRPYVLKPVAEGSSAISAHIGGVTEAEHRLALAKSAVPIRRARARAELYRLAFLLGRAPADYPREAIVSPYGFKTAREHYEALLAEIAEVRRAAAAAKQKGKNP